MTLELLLDMTLAGTLVGVAYCAIHSPALFTAVVVYIVYGAMMAVVWVRLGAPDVAITEAAIGAGITGALLLGAAQQLSDGEPPRADDEAGREQEGEEGSSAAGAPRRWLSAIGRWGAVAAGVGVAAVLGTILPSLGDRRAELPQTIIEQLPASGVEHPVTAVLLNFRAYDTWLEVGVLLVAAVGILGLLAPGTIAPSLERGNEPPAVATSAAALLGPAGVLIAGYLLWRGSHGPGGAFQAGAVLASVAVLLMLLDRSPLARLTDRSRTAALVAGPGIFLAVGLAGLANGGSFLEYGAWAGLAIVVIEVAVSVSVAFTLALLFAGSRATVAESDSRPR